MTYTKGPWKFDRSESGNGWGIVTAGRGNIVANVNSETGPDLPPLVSTKMPMEANSRLIAAAPELLEACKAVLTRKDWPVGTCKIKKQLEEAVSKAEAL